MYKVLLATDQTEIQDAFSAVTTWGDMGFRQPRVVTSARQAIESLKAHHADGIAIALPEADKKTLMAHLATDYPILPIFSVGRTPGEVIASVEELRRLLNRTHMDFSNDDFGEKDMLQVCRHEFFRALLGGKIHEKEQVQRYLKLLRSRMDPTKPCVVVDMMLPEGDDFLSGRWHYGSDRLEVALRNFFGAELNGMRMLVSVLPDERIRLLCCPMLGAENTPESITGVVAKHAQDAMAHVAEYLDLELRIVDIQILPALTSLAEA